MTDTKTKELIKQVMQKHSIRDYLATKGFFPVRETSERLSFICPLHNETQPSLSVYNNDDNTQSYFCWGCKKYGNIITMKAELEHLGFYDTLKLLGEGIEISDESVLDSIISQLKAETEIKNKNNFKKISERLSLKFSALSHCFFKNTNCDPKVLIDLEKIYHEFDKFLWTEDIDSLEDFYDIVISNKLFAQKLKIWKSQKHE